MNVAFETRETRSFLNLTGNALLFSAIAIILSAVAVYLSALLPEVLGRYVPTLLAILIEFLRWSFAFLAVALMIGLIYRIGPDRHTDPCGMGLVGQRDRSSRLDSGNSCIQLVRAELWQLRPRVWRSRRHSGISHLIWLSLVILLPGAELDCELERTGRGNLPNN